MTSRELTLRTLDFSNDARVPRNLWALPWANFIYPDELNAIRRDFPDDFAGADAKYERLPATAGDAYEIGEYRDGWGCVFTNIQRGVIGEVKEPLIAPNDEDWEDTSRVHIPYELLSFDIDSVNRAYKNTDGFMTGGCCPRPFEQLQFLRGSENLLADLAHPSPGLLKFIAKIHAFYCELLEKWAQTDVDALNFMDDWGTQNDLLINPKTWRTVFKPLYKDYIDIAHMHGKRIFMHSDGNTSKIIPDLIELGLDAINTQIFCIGINNLAKFKGKITFWGEIDRQHLLPYGSIEDIRSAVNKVRDTLWTRGGCIAQCEFGIGAKPENVREVFAAWDAE